LWKVVKGENLLGRSGNGLSGNSPKLWRIIIPFLIRRRLSIIDSRGRLEDAHLQIADTLFGDG
jgi:hypothetical protein